MFDRTAALHTARSRPELMGTYIVDITAMFFGMPMALFPAIAEEFGGAGVLGLLYAAPAVGSLLAMAREILDEYRLTVRLPAFDAWLVAGAPSEDRSP